MAKVLTMAKRRQEIGPTAVRVARNVRKVRHDRGLSVNEVVKRTSGRLTADALKKLEAAGNPDASIVRRIDTDELVILAVALDTTPNRLLIGPRADDEEVELIDFEVKLPNGLSAPNNKSERVDTTPSARDAWRWARGGEPLHQGPGVTGLPEDEEDERRHFEEVHIQMEARRRRFQRENQPDDPPDTTDFGTLGAEKLSALDAVIDGALQPVLDALDARLPRKTIERYLWLRVDQALWERHREYLANRTEEDVAREREEGRRAAAQILGQDGADHPPRDAPED